MATADGVSVRVDRLVDSVERLLKDRWCRPRATYRLQFHPQHLTFREAAAVVPYLAELGISHVYASPCRKARAGSPHGYAIVDYNALNPELGTEDDYRAMAAAIHAQAMGQIQDIVPNHMCIESDGNPWWNDVLENGPGSPYAAYFDIEWKPVKEELENKILLPVLAGQYGEVLESGDLRLEYGAGTFFLRTPGRALPLDPKTFGMILGRGLAEFAAAFAGDPQDRLELESILTALEHLPDRNDTAAARTAERQREKEIIKGRLRALTERSAEIAGFVAERVREVNGTAGDSRSFDLLDRLLGAQVYRLSHWRTASDEINYRRFFDVNGLAAVCTERPEVFTETHKLVFDLLVCGDIDGLRIDHVDGLFDPMEYLWRLQWGFIRRLGRSAFDRMEDQGQGPGAGTGSPSENTRHDRWKEVEPLFLQAVTQRIGLVPLAMVFPETLQTLDPAGQGPGQNASRPTNDARPDVAPPPHRVPPLYVIVEKILGPEEPLPYDWPVAGTTGYDFLNTVGGLFVDPAGLKELTRNYCCFTGQDPDFREVAYETKRLILRVAMASELQGLAHRLNRLSERHRRTRDFTLNTLRIALREILACFPVYRTYLGKGVIPDRDRQFIQRAVGRAKRRNPARTSAAFDFIRDVLLMEQPPGLDEAGRHEREVFVGRFQQVTSPVIAKGIEDTAFYRYFPLSSLNEVGGGPDAGMTPLARFHAENAARLREYPYTLTCTTTHDTKRSEDVRARIGVLSEIPKLWRTAVSRWARLNRPLRTEIDGSPAPSSNDEYLFYQTLVGVWPLEPPDGQAVLRLSERLQTYMEKATREAKVHTSWINPVADYDAAVRQFVASALEVSRNRFLADFRAFHEHVVDWGLYTALSQVVLKLMSPGVSDIYQGQEHWDFSLVDPDNRRPVDFAVRREMLADLRAALGRGDAARLQLAGQLAHNPRDPRLKLLITWQLLQLRRRWAGLLQSGAYVPLSAEGSKAEHVCALAWRGSTDSGVPPPVAIVVVPRLLAGLTPAPYPSQPPPPLGPNVWDDTRLVAHDLEFPPMRNVLTGESYSLSGPSMMLGELLAHFPVAVLTSEASIASGCEYGRMPRVDAEGPRLA